MKYCIECNRNKATHGDFCDSCFNETKICRRCQQRKSIFEFEKINPQPPIGKPFHCPICKRTIIRQYKNDVVLDHFHNTSKIRGWICRMCNNSMGMMEDDVRILKRAIKWLQGTLK